MGIPKEEMGVMMQKLIMLALARNDAYENCKKALHEHDRIGCCLKRAKWALDPNWSNEDVDAYLRQGEGDND